MTEPKTAAERLRQLAADIPDEYRGPWRWHGQVGWGHMLTTVRHGLLYVMGARRLGMNGAQMEFADRRGDEKYHTMKAAKDLAIREVPYRDDIVGIDNPMARWIAGASPATVIEALDTAHAVPGDGLDEAWEAYWTGTYRVPVNLRTDQCRRETSDQHMRHILFAEGWYAARGASERERNA